MMPRLRSLSSLTYREAAMADRVLLIGWNRIVAGREQQALRLWQKSLEFYGKLQTDGRIESFEPVLLGAHGGDLNGFILLRGSAEQLAKVREEDTFIDIVVEANYCLEGFGVVPGSIGEGIADILSRYSKLIG
jgi:hypothetical protein